MPGFDGTGPLGLGPLTGGGYGFCLPRISYLPYRNSITGRYFRGYLRGHRGRGMRRGRFRIVN